MFVSPTDEPEKEESVEYDIGWPWLDKGGEMESRFLPDVPDKFPLSDYVIKKIIRNK